MSKFKKLAICGLAGVMAIGVGASMTACTKDQPWDGRTKVASNFSGTDASVNDWRGVVSDFGNDRAVDASFNVENSQQRTRFEQSMNNDKTRPDVFYFFSADVMARWKDKVYTREELKTMDKDILGDINPDAFSALPKDPSVMPLKFNSELMMYNPDILPKGTFEGTFDEMITALKADTHTDDSKKNTIGVNPQMPHYWMNTMLLNELGAEEFGSEPILTQKYFEKTGTHYKKWVDASKKVITDLRAMGIKTNATGSHVNFYKGKYGCMIEGNWNAKTLHDVEYTPTDVQAKLEVAAIPKMKDGKVHAIGGITGGWYVSKTAGKDPNRLKQALEFVKIQNQRATIDMYCTSGGGAPTSLDKDGKPTILNQGEKALKNVKAWAKITSDMKPADIVLAVDDRVPGAAKAAMFSDWTDSSLIYKMLTQAADPTDAEITAWFDAFVNLLTKQ